VVAAGRLFRAGIILNSADAIEKLATVDTIVFDKTGTLTLPEAVADGSSIDPDVLERAARLALSSHHPLAAALARCARERIPYTGVVEESGSGVHGTIEGREARLGSALYCGLAEQSKENKAADSVASTIFFTHAGRMAVIPIRQRLRPDAVAVVQALIARSLDLVILSGDRSKAVEPVATQLGITRWHAGLNPADKITAIEQLKSRGRRVLMIGDGLNDGPALAAATVSISPITAAQLTQARADALFLGEYLAPVLAAIAVSRRARSLMRQNLGLAIIYNVLAVPIAVAGMVTPLIAATAMSGSSLLVTLNALRGRFGRRPDFVADNGSSPTQATERIAQAKARVAENVPEDFGLKHLASARDHLEYIR
jgi:Cu2+-exporting ATPase